MPRDNVDKISPNIVSVDMVRTISATLSLVKVFLVHALIADHSVEQETLGSFPTNAVLAAMVIVIPFPLD